MLSLELIEPVRLFLERGGNVLLVIGAVVLMMWTLMIERIWYFRFVHPGRVDRVLEAWRDRPDHSSWYAGQIRNLLVSEVRNDLGRSIGIIKALVSLCPLLGLLGTVTGMIEVFDVMALSGSANARSMASGVSKATIPTMAGMVGALSGVFLVTMLTRRVEREVENLEDDLTTDH